MWYQLFAYTSIALGGYMFYNSAAVLSFFFNILTLKPGVGKIYSRTHPKTKKKILLVNTDLGKIRIPFVKLPSLDSEIYFFEDESIVHHSHIVPRKFFDENYMDKNFIPLKCYDMGIITDILKPTDFKNKTKIAGFISTMFEDYVYLFVLEGNHNDYEKLFADYDDALNNYDVIKLD